MALCFAALAIGSETAEIKEAFVILDYGTVTIQGADGKQRQATTSDSGRPTSIRLRAGDTASTVEGSTCRIICTDLGTLMLDGKGGVKLPTKAEQEKAKVAPSLQLLGGKLFLDIDGDKLSKQRKEFRLMTPTTILAVKGTQFFIRTADEEETAGVHEGEVLMYETQSKKHTTIRRGQAAMAKPGGITPARPMTADEQALSTSYDSLDIEFVDLEKRRRIFNPHSSDLGEIDPPKLFTSEKGVDFGNSYAIKTTFRPNLTDLKNNPRLETAVHTTHQHREQPKFFMFSIRCQGFSTFSTEANIHSDGRGYLSTRHRHAIPAGTKPGEWVTYCLPIVEKEEVNTTNGTTALCWFDFHATPENKTENLVMEISPIKIGIIADPKR